MAASKDAPAKFRPSSAELARFKSLFIEGDSQECWNWLGGICTYGHFWFRGKTVKAHVFALAVHLERAITGKTLHSCDNPICVNPAHLSEGTQSKNIKDAIARGRFKQTFKRGIDHPNGKLSAEEIRQIRVELGKPRANQRKIAEQFGVKQPAISKIKLGINHAD